MTLSRQNLLEGVDFKYLPHNTLTIFYKFLPEGYLKTQIWDIPGKMFSVFGCWVKDSRVTLQSPRHMCSPSLDIVSHGAIREGDTGVDNTLEYLDKIYFHWFNLI